MTTRLVPTLAALTVLSVAGAAHAQNAASNIATALGTEIRTGEASEEGSDVRWGTAVGVVDRPIDEVEAVIQSYADYHEFMPHFRTSRVLSQRGPNAMVYFEVGILRDTATLWCQVRIFARQPRGETRILEARMLQGNMDRFQARWELTPVDEGRTLVSFRILVDPDLPVPDSLKTEQNVKVARNTIRAVRRRMGLAP